MAEALDFFTHMSKLTNLSKCARPYRWPNNFLQDQMCTQAAPYIAYPYHLSTKWALINNEATASLSRPTEKWDIGVHLLHLLGKYFVVMCFAHPLVTCCVLTIGKDRRLQL